VALLRSFANPFFEKGPLEVKGGGFVDSPFGVPLTLLLLVVPFGMPL
jgi:hypothetical protein